MGIVNLSADSFSGDGIADANEALRHAERLAAEGAEIIDVGGESARTNRVAISEQEEIDRLCPFLEAWKAGRAAAGGTLLSINTWRPAVARAALSVAGDILNDTGALPTDENARTCARHRAALLIMHSKGEPKVPHTHVRYADVVDDVERFFRNRIQVAQDAGLPREAIILDPGIDFAKQREDNLRLLRHVERLVALGRPLLLAISRKTVIDDVLGISDPRERDEGTIACLTRGVLGGVSIFRVHNVRAAVQAIKVLWAVEQTG